MQFFTFFLLKTHFIRKYFILLYYFFNLFYMMCMTWHHFYFPLQVQRIFFMISLKFFSTLTQTLAHTHVINNFAKKKQKIHTKIFEQKNKTLFKDDNIRLYEHMSDVNISGNISFCNKRLIHTRKHFFLKQLGKSPTKTKNKNNNINIEIKSKCMTSTVKIFSKFQFTLNSKHYWPTNTLHLLA